jgi:hypothetical protein
MASLELAGPEAAELVAAMKVVGAEPPADRPCKRHSAMPQTRADFAQTLAGDASSGDLPLPIPEETANSPRMAMIAELRRDRKLLLASSNRSLRMPPARGSDTPAAGRPIDAALAKLIDIWPRLPKRTRDAILVLAANSAQRR